MFKGTVLKPTAVLVIVLFTWFSFSSGYHTAHAQDKPADKLTQGKERYDVGDYDTSIRLLEAYSAEQQNPREKRAEAYYFLAKNYHAVDPTKVKDLLLKAFETDWFLNLEEKDNYFKKISEEARQAFIEQIPVESYLERAENAFEQGKYDEAGYLYRVVFRKLPGKTFEKQIKKCRDAQSQKQTALEHHKKRKYAEAYPALKALLKLSPNDREVKTAVQQIETRKIFPMIETGNKHFNKGEYQKALFFFEEVLTLIPGDSAVREKSTACREILEQEKRAAARKIIENEGKRKRKKKKFPILAVLVAVGVGVLAYFLFIKKKKKEPQTGSIKVQSSPDGAEVWLDGRNTGQVTTTVLPDIAPGSHTVKLVKDGYQEYEATVTVEVGKETVLFATLNPNPTPDFVTNTDTVTVPEGGQNSFQVRLTERPASDINATVRWISGDADISILAGEDLTFTTTNWNTFQAVTLKAEEDDDTEDGQAIFRISAAGIADKDVIAVEQDRGGSGILSVSPEEDFSAAGSPGGPFSPTSKTYILQNIGSGSIQWTASNSEDWLTLSGTGGRLEAGTSTTVTVSINSNANALLAGSYTDSILFINTTNGNGSTTRTATLTVSN